MKPQTSIIFLLAISICICKNVDARQAAAPSSQGPGGNAQKTTQILIPASLTTYLDSKKLKPGGAVEVKTVGIVHLADGRVVSRGTKIVGHVTQAKARSGGDTESLLGVIFDKIDLTEGKVLLINGVIRAVAPKIDVGADPNMHGLNGHAPLGVSNRGALWPVPPLDEHSEGVEGIEKLHLYSDGLLKSDEKTVKLESGSQIILRVLLAGGD
ncbi:MAG: hypothetical protein WCC04_10755 [Terriglobales bacterium]